MTLPIMKLRTGSGWVCPHLKQRSGISHASIGGKEMEFSAGSVYPDVCGAVTVVSGAAATLESAEAAAGAGFCAVGAADFPSPLRKRDSKLSPMSVSG